MPRTTRPLAIAALIAPALALVATPPVAAAPPTCHGKPATIVGTPGDDRLVGTPRRDVIVARGGDDTVLGRGGNDLLCGGAGSDELMGGFGKDRVYGQGDKRWIDRLGSKILTGDLLSGGRGDDLLHPGPRMTGADIYEQDLVVFADSRRRVRVDMSTGPTSKRATAVGQGRDRIVWHDRLGVVGSPKDDHLVGSDKRDYLVGLWGDDRLEGAGGSDQLYPDRAEFAPGDAWPGGGGNDLVIGGEGRDDVHSTGGRDDIRGGAGDDVVSVRGGRGDRVNGDEGNDLLFAYFSGNARGLRGAVLDGGDEAGFDSDTAYLIGTHTRPGTKVTVDVATGLLRGEVGDTEQVGRIGGFGDFGLDGRLLWLYYGTDGRDEVMLDRGGRLHAWGRGGPDIFYGGQGRNRLRGEDGDDYLSGGPSDDLLNGGAGRDRLVGRAGTDTCREGERVRSCER